MILATTTLLLVLILVPVIIIASQRDPGLPPDPSRTVVSSAKPTEQAATLDRNKWNNTVIDPLRTEIKLIAFENNKSNIGLDTYGHGWREAECGTTFQDLAEHTKWWTFDCFMASSAMVISVINDDYPYQCRCRAVHSYLSQLFGRKVPPSALVRPRLWSLLHHWLAVTDGARESYLQPTNEALVHFQQVRDEESAHLFDTFVEPGKETYKSVWSDAPSHTINGKSMVSLAQHYKYNLEARAGYCEKSWREVCFAMPGPQSEYQSAKSTQSSKR